jgi:hypothetical protein
MPSEDQKLFDKKMLAYSLNAPFFAGIDGPPVFSQPLPDSSEVYDWANFYVSHGWSVIPLKEKDKKPVQSWGEFQKRLPSKEELRQWFPPGSRRNIGIVTGRISGINVVDFDSPEAYEAKMDREPVFAPLVKTGRGVHLFCKAAPGINNFQKRPDFEKIDFRGEGGFVVAPPSIHSTGVRYSWVENSVSLALTKLPRWVLRNPQREQSDKQHLHDGVAEGERNNTLASMAGRWFFEGNTLDDVLALANKWNLKNHPPMEEGEVETTVKSILKLHEAKQDDSTKVINQGKPLSLPDELLSVDKFDFSLLPDSLRPWAQDICERVQCPPDFVGAGIMASLAAVVGRKIGIRPQAFTDWTVVPNLWAMVVGRPGVLKSPALEATLAPLNRLVAKANEDYAEAYSEYKKKLTVAKLRAEAGEKAARKKLATAPTADVLALLAVDEPDEPLLKRYKANDTSPASLGELLRQNSNGLLVYRDELVSLLKGLDREDQAEGRGFYLTSWNGDSSYTFDRIGRGLNLNIEAVCLSILGGTQPGRLAEYIRHAVKGGAADDGLIQRFGLLVWPDTGSTWKNVDRWPDTDAKNQAFKIFDYLDKMDTAAIGAQQDTDFNGNPEGIPYLRFDADGQALFLEWRTDLETHLRSGDLPPALESHFAKYRKLIPALALIIHLADKGIGSVSEKATKQALAWGKYLETHARRAYSAITQPGVATAKSILKRIKKGDLPAFFSSRDVWRPGWSMLSDREQVAEALRLLVDYGYLREERNETGGRPSTIYHVIEEDRK